jgi:hypothetical protein
MMWVGAVLNRIDNGHATTGIYIEKDWKIIDDVQREVINTNSPYSKFGFSKLANSFS